LSCFYVHHDNPFLILGPFKYELKHQVPEIGVFHDLVSENEIEAVKQKSRGHMRTTPFVVKNYETSDYSKLRTSKVNNSFFSVIKMYQCMNFKGSLF